MNKIKIWIGTFGRALLVEKCKEMGIYQGNGCFFLFRRYSRYCRKWNF